MKLERVKVMVINIIIMVMFVWLVEFRYLVLVICIKNFMWVVWNVDLRFFVIVIKLKVWLEYFFSFFLVIILFVWLLE